MDSAILKMSFFSVVQLNAIKEMTMYKEQKLEITCIPNHPPITNILWIDTDPMKYI